MKLDVYEFSSKGGRDYNEDTVASNFDGDCGIFVAADGLGGHMFGELASETAAETIISGWDYAAENMSEQLEKRIIEANCRILELQKEKKAIMKTTVAALAINGSRAVWANSGDSRVYFFHKRELVSCTNDHSVAFKKYKAQEITREQIGSDEDQSRLLRTLGSAERYEPEMYAAEVQVLCGDAFLLCTDGAWEFIRDDEILVDLLKARNAKEWTELMLLRLMDRISGNNDNLSLLAVRCC